MPMLTAVSNLRNRLRQDKRGNVLMIFALSLPPLIFATGMSLDYGSAMQLQTKLNAAADAAALSATGTTMMSETVAISELRAREVFQAQVTDSAGLAPINYLDPSQFDVDVQEVNSPTDGLVRTATVTYRGESNNTFARILGSNSLTIKGTAVARASTAPNIDFYVMMDMSPSMALPITSAGLDQLRSITGCAFACHSTNDATAKAKDGSRKDYYGVAQSYSIPLRVDAEKLAVQNLTNSATSASTDNGATYRMYVATFHVKGQYAKIVDLADSYATVRSRAGAAQILTVYSNNYLRSDFYNEDMDTDYTDMFTNAISAMPNPAGNGMRTSGNKPQAVMMIITDGMRDEDASGRRIGPMPTAQCDTIKGRGIRIAILYTEYLRESMTGNEWSQTNVVPKLPLIAPALQSCASPGLFTQVTTNDDISAALNGLFLRTISTSRLTR